MHKGFAILHRLSTRASHSGGRVPALGGQALGFSEVAPPFPLKSSHCFFSLRMRIWRALPWSLACQSFGLLPVLTTIGSVVRQVCLPAEHLQQRGERDSVRSLSAALLWPAPLARLAGRSPSAPSSLFIVLLTLVESSHLSGGRNPHPSLRPQALCSDRAPPSVFTTSVSLTHARHAWK